MTQNPTAHKRIGESVRRTLNDVSAPSKKSFETPDERIELPGITAEAIEMADATISRSVFQPGTHCPQISYEGQPVCSAHHAGYVVDGMLYVEMQDGSVLEVGPNEVFDVPPVTTDGLSGIGHSWR